MQKVQTVPFYSCIFSRGPVQHLVIQPQLWAQTAGKCTILFLEAKNLIKYEVLTVEKDNEKRGRGGKF